MQDALQYQLDALKCEVADWGRSDSNKGQIYTRNEVVQFMLTTIGLNSRDDFKNARILEPSCGEGEFVVAIVDRLLGSYSKRPSVSQLAPKLIAVDLVSDSLEIAKNKVASKLKLKGFSKNEISDLFKHWFVESDFLLENMSSEFTHIIGNPPYVRVENIPKSLLSEYRRRYQTMTDRADLYIPFFEKSLSLLKDGGRLAFICTDRWTKNVYGKSLRKFISDSYSLELYIDLYGVDAFDRGVMTYPAITQIKKGKANQTILKHEVIFNNEEASNILAEINGEHVNPNVARNIVNNDKPWLLCSPEQLTLIKKLERRLPLIENTGCKVFIGAATGSNKVYIVDSSYVGTLIEKERLLPVVTANELKNGSINWRGRYLINTYDENGLIELDDYPLMASYLREHHEELSKRHTAKKNPSQWFRTIDRVYAERANMEKLLIPDISNKPIVLYDEGRFHPNNSIYYICSDKWELQALKVILLSNLTKFFISAYSTRVAKGYLRFQAQHLRKLRLPNWDDIELNLQKRLLNAGITDDVISYDELTCEVYQLSEEEKAIIGM
ncbi:MAG: Eco57I restriction-modification methylase domain-containing protein [Kangiella sp.]|nr:Eco57I restriction-modification methylase domain-containing protein [Kangiella sp.]